MSTAIAALPRPASAPEAAGLVPTAEVLDPDEAASQSSADVLEQILDDYQFIFRPEWRLKFKKELQGYTMGACLAKPWNSPQRWRLTAKPVDEESRVGRFVQKVLLVPSSHQVFLFTRKMTLGIFRLQLVGGLNWQRQKPTLDYRITTKWSDGPKIKRKERFALSNACLARCCWNLDLHLPDMEGHLGDTNTDAQTPLDVDFGHMDFEISQLDCVLDLDELVYNLRHRGCSDSS